MFYKLLNSIKQNPALFLNQPSVMDLQAFLLGFQTAKTAYNLPPDSEEQDFADFQQWVRQRYGVQTTQSWARIIDFFAVDEGGSLNLFFKLLDEYQHRPTSQSTSSPQTQGEAANQPSEVNAPVHV